MDYLAFPEVDVPGQHRKKLYRRASKIRVVLQRTEPLLTHGALNRPAMQQTEQGYVGAEFCFTLLTKGLMEWRFGKFQSFPLQKIYVCFHIRAFAL